MGKYRTINVDLDRNYRNDLNQNFTDIDTDITNLKGEIARVETVTVEKIDDLVGVGFVESLETARDSANTSAVEASTQANYAKSMGDKAKTKADEASEKALLAQSKADYANEKALLADEAAGKASLEVANLGQLKIDATAATQSANTASENAVTQANHAKSMGDFAKEKGDYASSVAQITLNNSTKAFMAAGDATTAADKANQAYTKAQAVADNTRGVGEYDDLVTYKVNNFVGYQGSTYICIKESKGNLPINTTYFQLAAMKGSDGIGAVDSVNNMSGNVVLTASDVNAIHVNQKGVPNGVALLNADGKVVDKDGNLVEGAVKSVNNQVGDVTIPVHEHANKTVLDNITQADLDTIGNHETRLSTVEMDVQDNSNKISLLSTVASTGSYNDLADKPDLSQYATVSQLNAKTPILKGLANFNSTTGAIIPHSIGHANYYVQVTPSQNPNGYLGEVWVEYSSTSFKVCCSGTAVTSFKYVVYA